MAERFENSSKTRGFIAALIAGTALLLAACGTAGENADPTATTTLFEPAAPGQTTAPPATLAPIPTIAISPRLTPTSRPEPGAEFDTTAFQELSPLPQLYQADRTQGPGSEYRASVPRDAIRPVYDPEFISNDEGSRLPADDDLVLGLNINGDARAYPVGLMRVREMVNDNVGGVPLLVTW